MSNCGNCGEHKNTPESVPYIVHEASMARMERQIKRLWIALIVAVCLAVVAPLTVHFGWLYYESQFETYEYTQDGEGTNIIGNGNDVTNGAETESQKEKEG
jgi:hypothetical protein